MDLLFSDLSFFAGLQLPQVRKYILFLLKNIANNAPIQICIKLKNLFIKMTFGVVLRPSCAEFCRNLQFAICG